MIKAIHPFAGAVALLTILVFWLSTVLCELFAGEAAVVAVKTSIPWGFLILLPALATAGLTGSRLGATLRGPLVTRKRSRMALVAANGLVVLVPSALYLSFKAGTGAFDTAFYAIQALELLAGGLNITLLARNMRDGLRMAGMLRPRRAAGA